MQGPARAPDRIRKNPLRRTLAAKSQWHIVQRMNGTGSSVLSRLLAECGLQDKAEPVGPDMVRLKWGSATVVCAARGAAIVAIAPMFAAPPAKDPDTFCRRLLELNAEMSGTASFAIQKDGQVVLQSGRGIDGLDAGELELLLSAVGKFADDYDDLLEAEFYR